MSFGSKDFGIIESEFVEQAQFLSGYIQKNDRENKKVHECEICRPQLDTSLSLDKETIPVMLQ